MAFSRVWKSILGIRDLTKKILQDSGKIKIFWRGTGFDRYSWSGIRQTLGMGSWACFSVSGWWQVFYLLMGINRKWFDKNWHINHFNQKLLTNQVCGPQWDWHALFGGSTSFAEEPPSWKAFILPTVPCGHKESRNLCNHQRSFQSNMATLGDEDKSSSASSEESRSSSWYLVQVNPFQQWH